MDGYLLKPGKREEHIDTIAKLLRELEAQKRETEKSLRMQTVLDFVGTRLGAELLLSVISGNVDEEGFEAYCSINEIEFGGGCVLTYLSSGGRPIKDRKEEAASCLERILSSRCRYLCAMTEDSLIIMLFIPGELTGDAAQEWVSRAEREISGQLRALYGGDLYCGTGSIRTSFRDMYGSYLSSLDAIRKGSGAAVRENGPDRPDRADDYIERARSFALSHFQEDISLEDCAEEVGISPYYLSHLFSEKTGSSFIEYLSDVRIGEAKRLCRNENMPIREIAMRCGCNNTNYFYRVFKKATGKTIGAYRRDLNVEDQ